MPVAAAGRLLALLVVRPAVLAGISTNVAFRGVSHHLTELDLANDYIHGGGDPAAADDTDAAGAQERRGPKVNLSPKARKRKHAEQFEKEFEVEISMVRARDTGLKLGLVLGWLNAWEPVFVDKIQKTSLVEEWNTAHPDKAIHPRDQIVRVNDISFHHSAETFLEHIKGQFLAGRKLIPGAKNVLTFLVQRPKAQSELRFADQREDLHNQLYSKEFTAELNVPENETSLKTMDRVLGWELKSTYDWEPVTIKNILKGGIVEQWNNKNPDDMILVGDQLLHVNKRHWLQNSTVFLAHLKFNYEHRDRLEGTFSIGLRRPRPVQEARDRASARDALHRQLYSREFTADLRLPESEVSARTMDSVMGWELNSAKSWEPVTVSKVVPGGALARWNRAHPEDAIVEGDEILHVNKRHWVHNSTLFMSHIAYNYEHRNNLTANGTFSLGLRRPRRVQEAHDKALELSNVSDRIELALGYWNFFFPDEPINISNRRMGDAVRSLVLARAAAAKDVVPAPGRTSAPAAGGARDAASGTEDDSDVIGASEDD